MGDWREPYRSRDASGSPDSAGQVGWNWLSEVAQQERTNDAVLLEIQTTKLGTDGQAGVLYRSTRPIAAYFLVRDPMNFAVLYRWKAESCAGNNSRVPPPRPPDAPPPSRPCR